MAVCGYPRLLYYTRTACYIGNDCPSVYDMHMQKQSQINSFISATNLCPLLLSRSETIRTRGLSPTKATRASCRDFMRSTHLTSLRSLPSNNIYAIRCHSGTIWEYPRTSVHPSPATHLGQLQEISVYFISKRYIPFITNSLITAPHQL